MKKWITMLAFVTVFAGCESQTSGEEGGWDPTKRVRVNGLYKWVRMDLTTGDTVKTFCRFFRFRNDGTYEKSEVAYLRPFYFDTLPHPDTTARFIISSQERGTFSVATDSVLLLTSEIRGIGMDDQFGPWGVGLGGGPQNITDGTYRVFTSDTWITNTIYSGQRNHPMDSCYTVMKRIGNENMEIPLASLRL